VASAFATTVEGRTKLLVPADSLTSRVPETFPVFFNPAAKLNRDVSVAVAAATRPADFLDVLAGTGARGVRIASESGADTRVTMVDFNRMALPYASKNARKNGVAQRCEVVHSEANAYLYSRFERDEKFDAVDVDPFGTPAPYLQAALVASADGATLSFTATDAAVLCGVYPAVALRRYGSAAPRSEFVHETAIRILVAFAVEMGGINDIGVSPLLAHSTLHYLRVFLTVTRGAKAADVSRGLLGFVTQCSACHSRSSGTAPLSKCPRCGSKVRSAGPLWVGSLCNGRTVAEAQRFCAAQGWKDSEATLSSLVGVDGFPPFSYSLERVASRLRVSSTQVQKVANVLRSSGYRCMRQPFEEVSIKTDAGYGEVEKAVREASGKPA
jgi:tRNA (guanine26-N2/guanine27-N2)-dimethyltransferase